MRFRFVSLVERSSTQVILSPHLPPVRQGGKLPAVPDDSYFDLSVKEGSIPSGWVLLEGLLCRTDGSVSSRLYWDVGNGFADANCIEIPITRRGAFHELVYLKPGVLGLRWQVSGTQGMPYQHQFKIRKIGLIERLFRMQLRTGAMFFKYHGKRRKAAELTFFRAICDLYGAYRVAAFMRLTPPDWTYRNWQYARWIRKHDTLSAEDEACIKQAIANMPAPPLISVLLPVYKVPVDLLRQTIESVLLQYYPHFELCIADDASDCEELTALLKAYAQSDSRIKVTFREFNGHISAATNTALSQATGPFVALLDHDDLLTRHALYWAATVILQHPDAEIIYSDEDKLGEAGLRQDPYFKPDWNPQLALSQNFVSHFGVYRTETLRQIGGFREGYEGSQDYDVMLRVAARAATGQIHHIPAILYHWRVRPGSTALGHTEKDYAWDAGRRAIADALSHQGVKASVTRAESPVFYRVNYALPDSLPMISIIIPTRNNASQLRRCVESLIQRSTYHNYEVIVVDNASTELEAIEYLNVLREMPAFNVIPYPASFNYSAINNLAATRAQGEVLCLLNNDTEVITPNWMEEMLGCLLQKDVGAVGARLLYPDGRVQHAGILLAGLGRIAMHAHAFIAKTDRGYGARAILAQDVSAVTGACMMVRKQVYNELNGLDAEHLAVAFNDVDFCLRLRDAGWRVVYTPYAELSHHESATRRKAIKRDRKEIMRREAEYMRQRWGGKLKRDPFYNPNLSYQRADFSLSHAPLVRRPWRE